MNLKHNSKKLSKLLALLMTVVMVFGMMPAMVLAETGKVRVIVENTTYPAKDGAPWEGVLVDEEIELTSDSTMMSCVIAALGDYSQTGAENNYISEINKLSAFDAGDESGWMGTLNDWFTNVGFGAITVAEGTLTDGDEIRIMYTTNGLGEDLGGSEGNNDKTVKAIEFSAGTLDKAFNAETNEYTLTLPAGTTAVKVTPTAANKNFQVRAYLGTQESGTEYKRTKEIPVKDGDVITVVCGDPSWPSMNNQAGGTGATVPKETYTFNVKVEDKGDIRLESLLINPALGNEDNAYEMIPAFDPAVKDYTIIVPDTMNGFTIHSKLPSGYPKATAKAEYTNCITNKAAEVELTDEVAVQNFIKYSKLTGNTMTITVDAGDGSGDKAVYNLTVKRSATLKELVLTDNTDSTKTFALDKNFKKIVYDYASFVSVDSVINVTATPTVATATAEVVGAAEGVFTPEWNDRKDEITVKVTAEGAASSTYTVKLFENPTKLVVASAPNKTEYKLGEKFDATGLSLKVTYADGGEGEVSLADVSWTPTSGFGPSDTKVTVSYNGMTAEIPVSLIRYAFKGSGTQEDPYLLENAADLSALSAEVNAGDAFTGKYFKITNDITLPDGWTPIGTLREGKTFSPILNVSNYYVFRGNIDGKKSETENYRITVPSGGKPLIGCPSGAKFSNIDIYGERINGYGLVEYYVNSKASDVYCTIDNVNIKSGSHIKMSGLIGGYASGSDTVLITNCTIEEGVVIGDDGSWEDLDKSYTYLWGPSGQVQYNDMVGSFAGAFNGTIRNCVSYATVYGRNYVGGIVGFKGQSMGDCIVDNCVFAGKVIAKGKYAGGIMGSGYEAGSAPNTPLVTIQNCLMSGSVEGADNVGGLLGGNAAAKQAWNNGIGYIRGNLVTGSVSATADNATVGGVIGYINAINRYNIIENNFYKEGIAAKGIGGIGSIDETSDHYKVDDSTKYEEPVAVSAAELANGKVVGMLNGTKAGNNAWKQGTNAPELSGNTRVYLLKSTLNSNPEKVFKSSIGYDNYSTSGYKVTAYYTDGTTKEFVPTEAAINGPDFTKAGYQRCSLVYDGYELFYGINVNKDGDAESPTLNVVTVEILGDSAHDVTKDNMHTLAKGNLTSWLGETKLLVSGEINAYEALEKAAAAYGFTFVANDTAYGKYVSSVTMNGVTLDATTNKQSDGKAYCGWQYTVNGAMVYTSFDKTALTNGDKLLFYFEDDYSLAYVSTAIDAIKAIPSTLTHENKGKVTDAENSLIYLSPEAMNEVKADSNYHLLTDAQAKLANAKAFDDAVDALPATSALTYADKATVDAVRAKYNALTSEEKGLVSDGKLAKLEEAEAKIKEFENAKLFDDEAAKLPKADDVQLSDKAAIEKVRKLYNDLAPEEKSLVNQEMLNKLVLDEQKIADLEAAKAVDDAIEALPSADKLKLSDKAAVEEARSKYNALTPVQRALLKKENADKLESLEAAISDMEAAKAVDDAIDAIDMTSADKAEQVTKARGAYEKLTDAQKKYVNNLSKLESYEQQLSDEEKAKGVEKLIEALPNAEDVKLSDEKVITDAKASYNALTDSQKKYVSDEAKDKLDKVKAAFNTLMAPVKAVEYEINALPDRMTEDDMSDLVNANDDYEALTDEQKEALSEEAKKRLENAKAQAAVINHTSGNVTAEGIEWDVKLIATPITEGEGHSAMKSAAKEKSLVSMYDIRFVKLIRGEYMPYEPETEANIIINEKALANYKDVAVLHEYAGEEKTVYGEIESKNADNKVAFTYVGEGGYGVVGNFVAPKTGDNASLILYMAALMTAAAVCIAVVVYRKKKA